jgi:hypothetical protein
LFTAVTLTILIEFCGEVKRIEFSAEDTDKVRCVLALVEFMVQVGTSLVKYLGDVIDLRHSTNVWVCGYNPTGYLAKPSSRLFLFKPELLTLKMLFNV